MSRLSHRICTLVAAAAILGASVVLAGTERVTAQVQSGRIELVAQTVWIGPEPVVIDLRVSSDAAEQQLEVRIHAPVTQPGSLRTAFNTPPTSNMISQFTVFNPDELTIGAGDVVSITLPDEEIGLSLRSEPGALPVVIDLKEDGEIVDTLVTALLWADPAERADRVDVSLSFIADVRSPLAHAVDQSIDIDPVALAERFSDFAERQHPPATVAFTPETLSALRSLDGGEGLPVITTIAETLNPHALFATPWVDLDEEAWRQVNEERLVLDGYALGHSVIEEELGRSASTVARLDHDATPATLGLLRTAGITGAVIDPDQINPVDVSRAFGQPLRVLDENDVALPVIPVATVLHDLLDRNDIELAAHQIFFELVLLSGVAETPQGFVIDLDTVNLPALDALLTRLGDDDHLHTAMVDQVLSLPGARSAAGDLIRTELLAEEPEMIGADATDLRLTEAVVDSYESMVAPAEAPIAPLRTLLLAVAASELDSDGRRAYTNEVFTTVSEGISGFEVLETSRITLASRTAELPITIRNSQPLPIHVTFTVTSEKLRFPDGEVRSLRLEPGLNELDLRVETVASGDARLTVNLTSPDGRIDLATGTVDIRSTAISGLGLIISVVALAVLGAWWARTILRIRRNRHAASVAAAASTEHPAGTEHPASTEHPSEEEP